MKVLVLGATGFTGSYVAPLLLAAGYEVRCLVRATSDTSVLPVDDVELVEGDLADMQSLRQAFQGTDCLVCVASLGFGHAPAIIQAAESRRAVLVSTTGIFTKLNPASKAVRVAAEQAIFESSLDYTVVRPTMIYGSPRDRNICRLIRYLQRWPVLPIVGSGEHVQQPVYVEDLAAGIVNCLAHDRTIGRAYNLSGAAPLTFNQLVDTVCQALGRKVRKLHVPVRPMVASLTVLERLFGRFPVSVEQLQRLNEDKAFDHREATRDFNYRPRSFAEGLQLELRSLGSTSPAAGRHSHKDWATVQYPLPNRQSCGPR